MPLRKNYRLRLVKTAFVFWIVVFLNRSALSFEIKDYPIVGSQRLELTREYCLLHYGLDSYKLKNPKMIVIHFTAMPTLKASLAAFKPDLLPDSRTEIKGHGLVNVGVHFLVDKNGDIYRLLPTNVIGRHAIGFNHVSLGIENVAGDASQLTDQQLKSDAYLVKILAVQYPSIEYLIGHHEYGKKDLPHYELFKELDRNYQLTKKDDPGDKFMADLRSDLQKTGLRFKN